jgi:hypothetical protein
MLLPIRRPVRPEPLPLRERASSGANVRPSPVWLSVRVKRHRQPAPTPSISPTRHGRRAAPRG